MPKGTDKFGQLLEVQDCYIEIPGAGNIYLNNLPDISDSKGASYNDETVIGRSYPIKTFSSGDNRSISMQLHFFVVNDRDAQLNLCYLKALKSAVYPREGGGVAPYLPPPVCKIKCKELLGSDPLCVVLKSYSVSFPTDVAWDENTYIPYKFDVDTSWEVVYKSSNLPGQNKIMDCTLP